MFEQFRSNKKKLKEEQLFTLIFIIFLVVSQAFEVFSTSETTGEDIETKPNDDFVSLTYDSLFQDDFEAIIFDKWALDPAVFLVEEKGNNVLSFSDNNYAYLTIGNDWTDYAVKFRFKIMKGAFHFNLRQIGGTRYLIGVQPDGVYFEKSLDGDFIHLVDTGIELENNAWHNMEVVANGTNIKVYLDEELTININDDELPLRTGRIGFESLNNSSVFFDDIIVEGIRIIQKTKWIKTGGPLGGLGYDVRIHPLNKSIMFVTDNPSGIQKSYDGGNTWHAKNDGITARTGPSDDGVPNFSLSIDPNDPDIIWAGMQGICGIFKSNNCGETWIKKDKGIEERETITFRGFAVQPGNSNVVIAAAEISTGIQGEIFEKTKGKIYKTVDAGENWYCVWEGDNLARVVIFDYQNPNTVYVSTGIFDREAINDVGVGILKSTDCGETWTQINNGLDNLFIGFLDMHPENPDILYAAAGGEILMHKGISGKIYKTTDGGEKWQEVLSGEGWFVLSVVAICPSDPNIVYAGHEGEFYRSDNGGITWKRLVRPNEPGWGPPKINPGIPISIVIDPDDPMTVFVNNYIGGVVKSTDGATTWTDSSKGYTGANLMDVAVNPFNSSTIYTVGRPGTFKSIDMGDNWMGLLAQNEICAIEINPSNPNVMLISNAWNTEIYRTKDEGETWNKVFQHPFEKEGGFRSYDFSPTNPDIVYAGMSCVDFDQTRRSTYGVYKSVDCGNSWFEINDGLEDSTKNIMDIAVHPSNSDIVYLATYHDGIYKTVDAGSTWTPKNNGLMSQCIRSIEIDPDNPDIIYAGLGEGVGIYKSTNGGETWEERNNGILVECPSYLQRVGQVKLGITLVKPKRITTQDYYSLSWSQIISIAIDPTNTSTIFAADERLGVYMSTDSGYSWTSINDGLTTRSISKLDISNDGSILYASTSGAGVFRLQLKTSQIPVEEKSTSREIPSTPEQESSTEEVSSIEGEPNERNILTFPHNLIIIIALVVGITVFWIFKEKKFQTSTKGAHTHVFYGYKLIG